ncbi:MAG: hypothetical protein WCE90_08805 [Candidatus Zixiibacteriota bacterium]
MKCKIQIADCKLQNYKSKFNIEKDKLISSPLGERKTDSLAPLRVCHNVVARFIEPNKLGNYIFVARYIGVKNSILLFMTHPLWEEGQKVRGKK